LISELEKKITLRYLRTKKKEGFINIISAFSFAGISLGVAVLIIVMSVMNGFRTELINKIVGFNPHVIIKPYEKTINFKKFEQREIKKISDEILITNSAEGLIINKEYTKGILLRAYKKNDFSKLSLVNKKEFIGNKKLNIKHISIGKELSYIINAKIGDKIVIMSPFGINTIVGSLPKQEAYIVDSIFESGLIEFDQSVAFLNIRDIEELFNLDVDSRYFEIFLKNPKNISSEKKILKNIFNEELIYTWDEQNKSLFSALKVERNVMFIILTLIIIVAAFNIISGLTILVKNKTKEIAILKSFGVQNNSIKKIFFLVGLIIGTSATIFGIILGVLFSIYIEEVRVLLSNVFGITLFPEEIYFLSKMPSEINFLSITIIGLVSILITVIVSLYPAIKAANLDPIKSLKYE
tara:strand:+ start:1567 stop:2796 length:1230 start_codon:yes stop_codon:yes gene_type:complete